MTWELSDLLRAIATTIVISIHASYHWWFGVKDVSTLNLEIFIDTAINQIGRFTVPIFVILSGFALAKSEEKRPFNLKIFIQRRLWRIIPPYLLFTLLNTVGRSQFLAADWLERGHQIFQAIASGMGDYHLYFLGIILQCYVFYPLLRHIPFNRDRLFLLLILTLLLFSLRWESATFGWLIQPSFFPDGNQIIYWLPYFQIGIWLAKDHGWTTELVYQKRSQLWGAIFAIAAILELGEFYWLAIYKNSAEAVGHYTRPTVFILTLTFLLWSISWRNWHWLNFPWQDWQIKNSANFFKKVQTHIKTFAKASFVTYLIHVWILRAIAPLEVVGGILFIPIAICLSWLGGIGVWRLVSLKQR